MNYHGSQDAYSTLDRYKRIPELSPCFHREFGEHLGQTLVMDIPAELSYIPIFGASLRIVLAQIENLAEPEIMLYNLELAVQEISVNIVKHAYAQASGRLHVAMTLSHQPLQITIMFHDTGRTFDPNSVPAPQPDELQEHGYGLFLVQQLMDEVEYKQRQPAIYGGW